jgi:serine phosphatase RsbU (regulator of sigma subunit)
MTATQTTSRFPGIDCFRQHLHAILPFILFFLTPLVLLTLFGLYAISLEEDFRHSENARELGEELTTIVQEADPAFFYQKLFQEVEETFLRQDDFRGEIPTAIRELFPTGSLAFECYRFNASGTIVFPEAETRDQPRNIVNLWKTLRGAKLTLEEMRSAYRPTLGINFPLSLPSKRPGEVFTTESSQGKGLICVFPTVTAKRHLAGSLFMIRKKPSSLDILQSSLFRRRSGRFSQPTVLAGIDIMGKAHRISPFKSTPATIPAPPDPPDLFWDPSFRHPLFTKVSRRSGKETFCAIRFSPNADLSATRASLKVGFLALGGITLLGFPLFLRFGESRFVSIKWKIPLFFLYATLLPLAGTLVLSHQVIRDRRNVMISEIQHQAIETLSRIDSDFLKEKAHALRIFGAFRDQVQNASSTAEIASLAIELKARKEVSWVEVRDKQARRLTTTWGQENQQDLESLTVTIAKVCLKRFLPGLPPQDTSLQLTVAQTFLSDIFLCAATGWPRVLERPEELHSLKFSDWDLYLFWSAFSPGSTGAAFVHAHQRIYFLRVLFLRNLLSSDTAASHAPFRLFSFDENRGVPFPDEPKNETGLKKFFHLIRIAQEPVFGEILLEDTRFLATGIPGRFLDGFSLLALYPISEIDRAVNRINVFVRNGVAAGLLLVLFVAFTLTDAFLRPIHELTKGVKALRDRDSRVRINVIGRDELGRLATVLNKTLADAEELFLAHSVQAQLIPQVMPDIPGYSIDLMSHPARDLGGDYCDVQPLPNGEYLIVIGDVTGHGVSSALVMTMAKAGVLDYIATDLPLTELLKRLNTLFSSHFQREVVMTFFAAILNPETGRFRYSCAGHPGPIYLKNNGEVDRLMIPHPPLGFSPRSTRLKESELTMAPGEMIVLFTDLLMEMQNPKGVSWGPANLIGFLSERKNLSTDQVLQEVFTQATSWTGSAAFEDDFSVIVLKRTQPQ